MSPLRKSRAPANESQRDEFEAFVYHVSHDVRASVRALTELPGWIIDDLAEADITVPATVGESLELMQRHTRRLDRMMADLLIFSRIGRWSPPRQIDLAQVLGTVLGGLNFPSGFQIDQDLEVRKILIGEEDLRQLLAALLANTIKHRDTDSGVVSVSSRRDKGSVVISVSDEGPGIDPKHAKRVFEVMSTLKARDEVEGSGMGLAIAQKAAQHYGGCIRLKAAPARRGNMFEVRLPASVLA